MPSIDSDLFWRWNQCVTQLTGLADVSLMPKYLLQALDVLLPSDIGVVIVYGEQRKPINIYDNAPDSLRVQNIDAYFEGPYLLDPYYRAGVNGTPSGLYCLGDVAPAGFRQSEYYKRYYKSSLIYDEVGFITHLADGCFAHISLVKLEGSPKFSKTAIEHLRLSQPVVDDVLNKFWQQASGEQTDPQLYTRLEAALGVFATSVLTKRECEVVQLYLHGHSTKSIAERLNISDHTVSLHRKNSYAKLDITSQAELFHLFIDSLSCIDSDLARDPLASYLNRD